MAGSHQHTATVSAFSDEELLERFLTGDDRAYVTMYERYDDRVLTYLRTIMREHPDVADDLFQETFVRLFRERSKRVTLTENGGTYASINNLRGWIFRVAHNLAMSYLRSLRQTVSLSEDERDGSGWDERLMVPIEDSFAQLFAEEDPVTGEQMQEHFRVCVEMLPQSLREVYVLRELNGLEYEQVAEIAGCSQEAARMRVSRARGALRKALEKYL